MSDYNFLMESRLSAEQLAVLTLISRLAAEHGQSSHLVGGAVRDLTFGQQIVRDLDFIVEGSLQRILRALPTANPKKVVRGQFETLVDPHLTLDRQEYDEHFSSAELTFSNGARAELSMCREEIHSRPVLRPEVRPASIFDDLKRRDFAINAMAVSLHPNSRGLLLDPTNGAGDIERREIRALQSRCFIDDPTRASTGFCDWPSGSILQSMSAPNDGWPPPWRMKLGRDWTPITRPGNSLPSCAKTIQTGFLRRWRSARFWSDWTRS